MAFAGEANGINGIDRAFVGQQGQQDPQCSGIPLVLWKSTRGSVWKDSVHGVHWVHGEQANLVFFFATRVNWVDSGRWIKQICVKDRG